MRPDSSVDEAFLAELLHALAAVQLEALVVGSAAAVLQSAPVMTQDIDLLVRDTPRNRHKLEKLCAILGATPMEISPLSSVRTLVGPAVPIDLIFDALPGGLRFESLKSRAVRIPVGKEPALVASLPDVIASKRAADRPKDHVHLPILEQTQRVLEAMRALRDSQPDE